MSLALFFFKIDLAIHDLLQFHTEFQIISSIKKLHWNFDMDCTEFVDCFDSMDIIYYF